MPEVEVKECSLVSRDEDENVVYRVQFGINRGLPYGRAPSISPSVKLMLGGRFLGFLRRERANELERLHRGFDGEVKHEFYDGDPRQGSRFCHFLELAKA